MSPLRVFKTRQRHEVPIRTINQYFQKNKTALPIIHLIDVIKPGVIDFSIVKQEDRISNLVRSGNTLTCFNFYCFQDCLSNAKYCITIARKIGAPVYALPEDISEVKHKMVMTVYASLMLADINQEMQMMNSLKTNQFNLPIVILNQYFLCIIHYHSLLLSDCHSLFDINLYILLSILSFYYKSISIYYTLSTKMLCLTKIGFLHLL